MLLEDIIEGLTDSSDLVNALLKTKRLLPESSAQGALQPLGHEQSRR